MSNEGLQERRAGRVMHVVALAGGLMLTALLATGPVGAQAQVAASVQSTAGGLSEAGEFALASIVGQPSPVGTVSGGEVILGSGFFFAQPPSGAPVVGHTQPPVQPADEDVMVNATVRSQIEVEEVQLHYRRGGDPGFTTVAMAASEDAYTATIPAEAVTSRGLVYFLTATDTRGRTRREPASGLYTVRVRVPELVKDRPQPAGTSETAYRLISFPLDLQDKNPRDILVDDLGSYDDSEWRFFSLEADQDYDELPNTANAVPGRGFWLIVRAQGQTIDMGPGTSLPLDQPFQIALHPQWNLIGTPFTFPIPVGALRTTSGQPVQLRTYDGSWNNPVGEQVQTMRPFEGYAVFNNTQEADMLLIEPGSGAAGKEGAIAPLTTKVRTDAAAFDWSIRITAQAGGARDVDNIAAVAASAMKGLDSLDLVEPPVIGDYVSVYFPHPEWQVPGVAYCMDVRPDGSEGEVWDVEVRTNVRDAVQLAFDGIADLPSQFDVWLVDPVRNVVQDLRTSNSYTFASMNVQQARPLRLVVGRPSFVEERVDKQQAAPQQFDLDHVYPNPFTETTAVHYRLPQQAPVTIRVYDVLGATVATLMDDPAHPAGEHVVVWDGTTTAHGVAASGIYFVRMQAGSFSTTRKIVRVH